VSAATISKDTMWDATLIESELYKKLGLKYPTDTRVKALQNL